jgi:hypothetical protein
VTAPPSPFEVWRRQYQSARYLEYASRAELLERAQELIRNTIAVLDYYRFEGIRANPADEECMRALTELRFEFSLRGYSFPPSRGFVRDVRPVYGSPAALRAAEAAIRSYPRPSGPVLVRYLRNEYARAFVADGILRLTPASFYIDRSLDLARHDDESMRFFQNGPADFCLTHVTSGRKTRFTRSISYGAALATDYYLVSLSRVLNPCLFLAFGVDGCVVVKDPPALVDALEAALPEKLAGRWDLMLKRVDYIDPWPLNPPGTAPPDQKDLYFMKDYRFCYQQEVRIAVVPAAPLHGPLTPITVKLAIPSGTCDLLVLPGSDA